MHPSVRASPDQVARLLAEEFIEFRRSGRVYSKRPNCFNRNNEGLSVRDDDDDRLACRPGGVLPGASRPTDHDYGRREKSLFLFRKTAFSSAMP
jgi:hypothetical protein